MSLVQGNSSSNSINPPGVKAYVPPKGWDELTDSEKIERMRELIKQQYSSINNQSQDINWLKNLFFKHDHDPRDGKLTVQPETYRQSGFGSLDSASALHSDKPYF